MILVALLLAACSGGQSLPWSEDFSSPGTWLTESDATAEVGVQDGVLRVHVIVPNQLAWASAGVDFSDLRLTVEATQVGGPDDNEYGVLVRMRDPSNFYRFSISGDGYFQVTRFVDGVEEPVGSGWTRSDAIHQGEATNLIEVVADGSRLILRVNGQELTRVEDTHFSHGDIGLFAGTFYEGGVEVHFDNLHVTSP